MTLAVSRTQLTELAASEASLAADLAARDGAWASEPSALPDWTRAHVVAHLAGNAYGLINLCEWAASGVETLMYPSKENRVSEIERRAALPWAQLVQAVQDSADALGARLAHLTEPLQTRAVRLGSGTPVLATDLAVARILEIEVHRVDLAADYQPVDWTEPFTVRTLGKLAPFFLTHRDVPAGRLRSIDSGRCWQVGASGPDLLGTEADLLAWLLGRPHGPLRTSDSDSDSDPLPVAPAWV